VTRKAAWWWLTASVSCEVCEQRMWRPAVTHSRRTRERPPGSPRLQGQTRRRNTSTRAPVTVSKPALLLKNARMAISFIHAHCPSFMYTPRSIPRVQLNAFVELVLSSTLPPLVRLRHLDNPPPARHSTAGSHRHIATQHTPRSQQSQLTLVFAQTPQTRCSTMKGCLQVTRDCHSKHVRRVPAREPTAVNAARRRTRTTPRATA